LRSSAEWTFGRTRLPTDFEVTCDKKSGRARIWERVYYDLGYIISEERRADVVDAYGHSFARRKIPSLSKCLWAQGRAHKGMHTPRKAERRALAAVLSAADGETLSSRSYIIMSERVERDFSSMRSDEEGT
jgi:hypothetical protein